MRFTRRRPDRSDPARNFLRSGLEALERRELLANNALPGIYNEPFAPYVPSDFFVVNPITDAPLTLTAQHLLQPGDPNSPLLNNTGKVVSGVDRQGDQWTITVHGPGLVTVTDSTPNDGTLDDVIGTIQLSGTSFNSTYVTGTVVASNRVLSTGTVDFNQLIDNSGVKSIVLNGFNLTQTIPPPTGQLNNSNTFISLTGGVGTLSFNSVIANIDESTDDQPINMVLGGNPAGTATTVDINNIYNTVFDSSNINGKNPVVPTMPITTPTVNLIINGAVQSLNIGNASQAAQPSSVQYLYPIVGSTGRTNIQATSINNLNFAGSAINTTISRSGEPLNATHTSGLTSLGSADFGGIADALNLDVNGPIKSLIFERGLGNPQNNTTPETNWGMAGNENGYPSAGLLGGTVTATNINRLALGTANFQRLTAQNPNYVQLLQLRSPTYFFFPGNSLTNSSITASGSIGKTSVLGNIVNSEIKSGFDYPSFYAGLEGTRAGSRIGPITATGDTVNGVVSATYRPGENNQYGAAGSIAGPGTITGKFTGVRYITGGTTPLGNTGSGFFARDKSAGLPPPDRSIPTGGPHIF